MSLDKYFAPAVEGEVFHLVNTDEFYAIRSVKHEGPFCSQVIETWRKLPKKHTRRKTTPPQVRGDKYYATEKWSPLQEKERQARLEKMRQQADSPTFEGFDLPPSTEVGDINLRGLKAFCDTVLDKCGFHPIQSYNED